MLKSIKTSKLQKIMGVTALGLGLLSAILLTTLQPWERAALLSPVSATTTFQFLDFFTQEIAMDKKVLGFLPYWNIQEVSLQNELTDLAFFSLTIAEDGSVLVTESTGGTEPGLRTLKSERLTELMSEMEARDQSFTLVFSQFENETIETFLGSKVARETFITTMDNLIISYPIEGINIDIEYNGVASDELRADYVSFIQSIDSHLDQKYNNVELSIDVFASASQRKLIWDMPALEPMIDYVVVMAYDFHRKSSPVAGPVAPIFGGNDLWNDDINQYLESFLVTIPSEKILLGVPFYGYQWQTTGRDGLSPTFPNSGSTARFETVQQLLKDREGINLEQHWDDVALTPYLTYEKDDRIYTIYYDDARSLAYKMDLVNQLGLAGIAIWALGYEGQDRELWDVINQYFVTEN